LPDSGHRATRPGVGRNVADLAEQEITTMTAHASFEALESRRLASVSLGGANILVNPDAEMGSATTDAATTPVIPGWKTQGLFSVVKYDSPGFMKTSDVVLAHGNNFFSGGRIGLPSSGVKLMPTASQTIDISRFATDIDAGRIMVGGTFPLGGFGKEEDTMNAQIDFTDSNGFVTNSRHFDGPTAKDRGYQTGLVGYGFGLDVPVGTRFITVTLQAVRKQGWVADGYADQLYLRMDSTMKDSIVTGKVFKDVNGNGKQDKNETAGVAGVFVYTDTNSFGEPDLTKPCAVTDASGNYTLAHVKPGRVAIHTEGVQGLRNSGPATIVVKAAAGVTTVAPQSFAFSERALISGFVVRNANGKPVLDDPGTGIGDILVYLDTNGNGKLDAKEARTRTDSTGAFSFNVAPGKYQMRVQSTSLFKQRTPAKDGSIKVSVAKGSVSGGNIFSMERMRP
jgi:hypothetical protein